MGVNEHGVELGVNVKLAVGFAIIVTVCGTESLHAATVSSLTNQTVYVPERA